MYGQSFRGTSVALEDCNEAKRGVKFCHSTRNVSRTQRNGRSSGTERNSRNGNGIVGGGEHFPFRWPIRSFCLVFLHKKSVSTLGPQVPFANPALLSKIFLFPLYGKIFYRHHIYCLVFLHNVCRYISLTLI